MTGDPIIVEQIFKAARHVVWEAITEPDQMRQWFFEQIEEFEARVGFETGFDVECEGEIYSHEWRVMQVEPEESIAYDWNYGGHPGSSVVVWELGEVPDGIRLKLTHSGGETFPQDNPVFRRESCEAGWRYFINQRLPLFLEGQLDG